MRETLNDCGPTVNKTEWKKEEEEGNAVPELPHVIKEVTFLLFSTLSNACSLTKHAPANGQRKVKHCKISHYTL